MKVSSRIVLLFCSWLFVQSNCSEWTWSYKKNFYEVPGSILKQQRSFANNNTPVFNQLVFSWNAVRPTRGHFTFLVKAKLMSGEWTQWFKMIDWGASVQRSYSFNASRAKYQHVRLEVPEGATGFSIKVEAHGGADLSLLKMISVSIADLSKFSIDRVAVMQDLPSFQIAGIPCKSQMVVPHEHAKRMCSPTSTTMLLSYLTKKHINPLDVALNTFDKGLDSYGSWPFNAAHAFERCPLANFRVLRLSSFTSLHEYLLRGTPVVVSVRGYLETAPQNYPQGHLLLVTGWDQKNNLVTVHDPAFDEDAKVYHQYKLSDFLRAWERSHRLAYVAELID